MKRTVTAVAVLAGLLACAASLAVASGGAPSGTWSATESMSLSRIDHTATRLRDGRVLVAGGVTTGRVTTATTEIFDPSSGTWTPSAVMDKARSRHVAVLLADGDVLVAGGQTADGAATASAELYHPSSNTWTATSSMAVARFNFTAATLLDGRVLVSGGVGGDGSGVAVEKSAELYDPSLRTWQPTGAMANRRFDHAAVRLADGRVLAAGGANAAGDCVYKATAELYAPATGTWQNADPMTTPRGLPAALLMPSGKVLAAGGLTSPANCVAGFNATDTAELYDADSDR